MIFPSSVLLICAINPCPCGNSQSNMRYCPCTTKQIISYQNRQSGPIEDRFDLSSILLPTIIEKEIHERREPSHKILERVIQARKIQKQRFQSEIHNGTATLEQLLKNSHLQPDQWCALQSVSEKRGWSNRVQTKIIRIARTLADLVNSENIKDEHLQEAIQLRKEWKQSYQS